MDSDGIPGLAERLDHLFLTVSAPTKSGRYSNDAASLALAERGVIVSGVHLSHLRSGRRDNPSARLLVALADLFGVPFEYFFDSAVQTRVKEDLVALGALQDPRVKGLVRRSAGVSDESLDVVTGMLDRIRALEGLDRT